MKNEKQPKPLIYLFNYDIIHQNMLIYIYISIIYKFYQRFTIIL